MYRAIIVDDEETVRQGLINHFNWAKYGLEVVGDFPDGRKALQYITEHPVDLIVTDVRMPHLNGIELTRTVRERFPRTKIIFISGYDDTDYLHDALKMEAVDYILKSIDLDEFERTIAHVMAKIDKENARDQTIAELEKKLTMSIPLLQQRTLMLLVREGVKAELEEISQERISFLNIPLCNDTHYCIVVLQLTDLWKTITNMTERQGLIFSLQFQTEITEILRQYGSEVCFDNRLGEYVLFVDAESEKYENILLSVADDLQKHVTDRYGMRCQIGISERFKGIDKIRLAYESAVNAIQKRYLLSGSQSISIDKFVEVVTIRSAKDRAEKDVSGALLSGDPARVKVTMEAVFADLEALTPADQQNFLIFLLLLPTRILTNVRSGEHSSYADHRKLLERFLYLADIREQKLLLLALYEEVTEILNTRSESQSSYIIERIKQAIESHYMEQLSIASLAGEVYLTPTYLCVLFKHATGMTLNEYITFVRMQHAKVLLSNPHIKLYDVCYQVGYLSPSYFSKLFRKFSGLTPTEFREASLHHI